MSKRKSVRAKALCRHFDGGDLAGGAHPGLGALKAEHRPRIRAETVASCSIDLDRHRQPVEPDVDRWDYVITLRDSDAAIAIEPHPAVASEVDGVIRKKEWAEALLASHAPAITVQKWVWLTGSDQEPYFARTHPAARRLADAGITFPLVRVDLDG